MTSQHFPLIDAHIHLYAATHLSRLNWTSTLPPGHILNQQRSVKDYKRDTGENVDLLGFLFLETDCKSSLDPSGWDDALDELRFLTRIAHGLPFDGEGHVDDDRQLLLGMVPWAPIAAGPDALEQYVVRVREICSDSECFSLVKGFRYLVQDKTPGTMLQASFIAGLQWLGRNDFVFDLGVDARSGGLWQLQEACEMLRAVYKEGRGLKVVINHFCKPNLHVSPEEIRAGSTDFSVWATRIRELSGFPNTFMKLSGLFSELPIQRETTPTPVADLIDQIMPWADVVFDAFTPSRIMFGSDWPVCTVNGPGSQSWQHWRDVVAGILQARNLCEADQRQIWSGTAIQAYNIQLHRRSY